MKGITIKLPVNNNEKIDFYNYNLIGENSADELYNEMYGYAAAFEPYDVLKIPNNLDEFTEFLGYHSTIDGFGTTGNHSGIEIVILPEIAMESDNVFDALYCLYFEVESNKLNKIMLIDYIDAINKANECNKINLKNKLTSCVKELQKLKVELEETLFDDVDAIENFTFETLTNIADKYNTGNIIELGANIDESIVDVEINTNPGYIDSVIYDKVELIVDEKLDDVADKIADVVDQKLLEIEKLIIDGKSRDEILSAINNVKIKTKK